MSSKKIHYGITALLLIAVIAAALFLPEMIVSHRSGIHADQVETSPLMAQEQYTYSEATLMDKLDILRLYEVNPSVLATVQLPQGARLDGESLGAAYVEAMTSLHALGLIPEVNCTSDDVKQADPVLIQLAGAPARCMIRWRLHAQTQNYGADLLLDDETGKVLAIHLTTPGDAHPLDEKTAVVWLRYLGVAGEITAETGVAGDESTFRVRWMEDQRDSSFLVHTAGDDMAAGRLAETAAGITG